MATLTLRLDKGSALTYQELDDNLSNINNEVEILLESQANFMFDGSGSVLTTSMAVDLVVPFDATITSWSILGDVSGSITFGITKTTYSSFPTASSIVASAPPTMTTAQKATSSTLTGWTTTINAGDILQVTISSVSTLTRASLFLGLLREYVAP